MLEDQPPQVPVLFPVFELVAVAAAGPTTVLVAPLDPQLAAPVKDTSNSITAPAKATAPIPTPTAAITHNGRREPVNDEALDSLATAEELRDVLARGGFHEHDRA